MDTDVQQEAKKMIGSIRESLWAPLKIICVQRRMKIRDAVEEAVTDWIEKHRK